MLKKLSLPILILAVLSTLIWSCEPSDPTFKKEVNPNFQEEAKKPEFFHRSMKKLTDVIIHDIFSPPQASRIYAYPSIAAYECLLHAYPDYQSLSGQLHELKNVPQPEKGKEYCYPLASTHAFLKTGKALIFSEDKIEAFQDEVYQEFKDLGISKEVYDNSIAFGDTMTSHIMAWIKEDMYNETRTYPKYTIPRDPSKWKPTPPDYMDGIEPHWREIRTMVIDSAGQFPPPPPTEFSTKKNSPVL